MVELAVVSFSFLCRHSLHTSVVLKQYVLTVRPKPFCTTGIEQRSPFNPRSHILFFFTLCVCISQPFPWVLSCDECFYFVDNHLKSTRWWVVGVCISQGCRSLCCFCFFYFCVISSLIISKPKNRCPFFGCTDEMEVELGGVFFKSLQKVNLISCSHP